MKRIAAAVLALVMTAAIFSGCDKKNDSSAEKTLNTNLLQQTNFFDGQNSIDAQLKAEADKQYTFDKPSVIVNPYGVSPLAAVAVFTTDSEIGGKITVKGRKKEDDVNGTFPKAKNHIVPIYGLYNDGKTNVVLTLDDGRTTEFTVETEKVDIGASEADAEMLDASKYDYGKMTLVCAFNGYLYMLDSKGDVRWAYNEGGVFGVKRLENGHLIVPSKYTLKPQYYKEGVKEIDLLGKVYNEFAVPGGMHHDTFELSNGNLLVAADQDDLESVEDRVVEIDRETGKVVWDLDMKTLIGVNEGGSINRSDEDWFHNNGIWYDEPSDTLLLSARHVDAIVAVNKTEKTLKWILGNPDGWSEKYQKYFFTPRGDDFEWQYAQHEVTMLSNGNIMCFDNGAGRTKVGKEDRKVTGKDVYSRVVVYDIDEKNMTIEQVYQFGKEEGGWFNSSWVSGANELDGDPDNLWMTAGSNLYDKKNDTYDFYPPDMFRPELVQSTQIVQNVNDKTVYRMTLHHLTFRTLRLPVYTGNGDFDVNYKGKYLGSLPANKTAEADVSVDNAPAAEGVTVALDPVKLTVDASYNIASKKDAEIDFLVLKASNGTVRSYKLNSAPLDADGGVKVTVSGWVSRTGLEGAAYDVYVVLNGKTYNTGYRLEL